MKKECCPEHSIKNKRVLRETHSSGGRGCCEKYLARVLVYWRLIILTGRSVEQLLTGGDIAGNVGELHPFVIVLQHLLEIKLDLLSLSS